MTNPLSVLERVEGWVDPCAPDEREDADRLRVFLERVLPPGRGDALEANAQFPGAELRAFATEGFVRALVPEDRGGRLDWSRAMRTATRLAAHDLDVVLCLGGTVLASIPVLLAGTSEQRARYFDRVLEGEMGALALSEVAHGSDLLAGECRARPVDDAGNAASEATATAFIVDGEKAPSNNATIAANLVVLARTSDASDASSHSLFLVPRDTPGLEPRARFDSIGYRSMDLSGARFTGASLPRAAVLGAVGDGFLIARRSLEISRSGVAMMAVGAHAAVLARALEHAKERRLYGAPIAEIGGVRRLLAGIAVRLVLATALGRRAARTIAAYGVGGRGWSSAAKLMCPLLLESSVHDAGTILGAHSLRNDLPFGRLRRAAPVLAIFDGSSQLQLNELWRHAAGWTTRKGTEKLGGDLVSLWDARKRPFTADREDHGLVARLRPPAVLAAFGGSRLAPLARAAEAVAETAHDLRGKPQAICFRVSEAAGFVASIAALVEAREQTPSEVLDACVGLAAAFVAPIVAARLAEVGTIMPELLALNADAAAYEARVADVVLA